MHRQEQRHEAGPFGRGGRWRLEGLHGLAWIGSLVDNLHNARGRDRSDARHQLQRAQPGQQAVRVLQKTQVGQQVLHMQCP